MKWEWLIGTANTPYTKHANHWLLLCAHSMTASNRAAATKTASSRECKTLLCSNVCALLWPDANWWLVFFSCSFVRRNCRRLRQRRRRRSSSFSIQLVFFSLSFFLLRLIREIKIRWWMYGRRKKNWNLNGDNWRYGLSDCRSSSSIFFHPFPPCIWNHLPLWVVMLSLQLPLLGMRVRGMEKIAITHDVVQCERNYKIWMSAIEST